MEPNIIQNKIYEIRVMLDFDLAELYQVETKVLKQASRLPEHSKLELLERNDEDNLEAINDLSEDMRHEIDNIYMAIAALSVKPADTPEEPVKKIGFK